VTAEGLAAIRVAGRTLASGGWSVFNAEPWFKTAAARRETGPVERRPSKCSGRTCPVTQAGGQIVSTTDYTFDREDVTISARIENRIRRAINVLGFSA